MNYRILLNRLDILYFREVLCIFDPDFGTNFQRLVLVIFSKKIFPEPSERSRFGSMASILSLNTRYIWHLCITNLLFFTAYLII